MIGLASEKSLEQEQAVAMTWNEAFESLSQRTREQLIRGEPLSKHTTLRVGGPAEFFVYAKDRDTLAEIAALSQIHNLPLFLLGDGSNVCVSDAGLRGMTLRNGCRHAEIGETSFVETGHNLMRLFMKSLQAGLSGLEYAVGIPGTVGGALVSNAGAYRSNICDIVRKIEVLEGGVRRWVDPSWMEFSYRDSRLRRGDGKPAALLAVTLELTPALRPVIRAKSKDFQNQRISKQPWEPSAGSWFKNVLDIELAESLPQLTEGMRKSGVVPAGYLTEACGLKGFSIGGAMIAPRHANFIVNRGNAAAADLRAVADYAKRCVFERFGVRLEAEVMQIGD